MAVQTDRMRSVWLHHVFRELFEHVLDDGNLYRQAVHCV